MAYTIGQIAAVSYPAVLAEMRKAANQWAESALMRELEDQGAIERRSLGSTIEAPLDYQRNPGTVIQATDLQPLSMTKTEVLTAASYDIAEITAPIVWSKKDEVMNPSENQKIALVKSLLTNGIDSHDDILEQSLFLTSTNGFLGLLTHCPTNGQGSDGGIDSALNVMWRSQSATYVDDTDIEAAFTTVWNSCAKGSGSKLLPTLIASDGATQALFEGTQQALQRWSNTNELNAGFKKLKFKNANYVFSQYGTTTAYFLNRKTSRWSSRKSTSATSPTRRNSKTRTASPRASTARARRSSTTDRASAACTCKSVFLARTHQSVFRKGRISPCRTKSDISPRRRAS